MTELHASIRAIARPRRIASLPLWIIEDGAVFHWVEADVPPPAEAGPAIEGAVTPDGPG